MLVAGHQLEMPAQLNHGGTFATFLEGALDGGGSGGIDGEHGGTLHAIRRRKRLLYGAGLVLALGMVSGSGATTTVPPSVLPGVGAGAERVVVDGAASPWRGVVRVQTEVGSHCTGALIGPRTVLTAAHCLFGRGTGRLVRPASVHVLAGYARGSYEGHARAVSMEIGPGFTVGPDGQRTPAAPADADWAVLQIDASLGTADRVLPLFAGLPTTGTAAVLGGFEQDRAQLIVADLDCRITGMQAGLLLHSCAGTRGVSGAPLLARGTGGWAVVGVATAARLGEPGGVAVPAATVSTLSRLIGR